MTTSDHLDGTWSRNRWLITGVGFFCLQVLLVVVLSERGLPHPPPLTRQPGLTVLDLRQEAQGFGRALEQSDPLLFAVPSARGRSGVGGEAVGEAGGLKPLGDAPVLWLPAHSNWFGAGAVGLETPPGLAPRPVAEKPGPLLSEVRPAPVPLPKASRLELEARLAERGLAALLPVPALSHSNVLDATHVQVCVEPDGGVFSALVLRSSGLKSADDQALALAWSARFRRLPAGGAPAPAVERMWGRMVFHWHVVGPEGKNGAAGGAP